ncbi:MAG: hypothetical protein ACE5L6_07930, partial [Candidatus Bathyarchaeia archaeon]
KELDQPSFDLVGRYLNVWHMWCEVFGDLEKAIETGRCDLFNIVESQESRQLTLETCFPELAQAVAHMPQRRTRGKDK